MPKPKTDGYVAKQVLEAADDRLLDAEEAVRQLVIEATRLGCTDIVEGLMGLASDLSIIQRTHAALISNDVERARRIVGLK